MLQPPSAGAPDAQPFMFRQPDRVGRLRRAVRMPGHAGERWLGKFGQADKWISCLTAAKVPQIRSKHDETSTADA